MSKITNDHVAKAKAKYGTIYVLGAQSDNSQTLNEINQDKPEEIEAVEGEFTPEAGKFYAILKKPGKREIGLSMTYKDPIQMGNSLLRNSIVEIDNESYVDDEILQNEEINIAAAIEVTQLINIGTAQLKKY